MANTDSARTHLGKLLPRAGSFLLVGGLFLGLSGELLPLVAAEKKPPPDPELLKWTEEITHLAPGAYRALRPVRIDFGLSWNNALNAGELSVEVNQAKESAANLWIGHAEGRSNGLARALWPYDVEADSHIDQATLRPRLFELSETERDKTYRYRLMFEPSEIQTQTVTLAAKVPEGETSPDPITKERTYRYQFVQDVLSTALYLRSHELATGDSIRLIVSPFNRPYYAEFSSIGREERKVKGETYQTIRLDVDIRKINFDRTLQHYDKMKKATIWLSDDEFRMPVEVHADIFVGFVSARVTRREWLDEKKSSVKTTPTVTPDKEEKKAKPAPGKAGVLQRLLGKGGK
ncbi:MAG: DUF3108 domain-containing protein [Verrucomicrobiae bacterium]|nr:DUF3108 domain-containing protein [Verrucomicrobiae bacterium]